MTVFEIDGKILIVDCGVLFPEEHQPGVDLILPDFEPIKDRLDDIVGVVLTHGHEDHIGAVPYLLRLRSRHPADRLAAHARARRGEAQGAPHQAVQPHRAARASASSSARSTSSSSRSTTRSPTRSPSPSRRRRAPCSRTGDFKMDQLPLDGRLTDLRAFARLGEEGVDLFMVDSTNADVPGFTPLERSIGPVLDQVIGQGPAPRDRRELLEPRAPRAAGAGRRRTPTAAASRSSAAAWCAT